MVYNNKQCHKAAVSLRLPVYNNDETVAVYSCHMLKKLYGGKIENLTPVLLKLLSKTNICYVGKIENGSYNFIIKM